MKGKHMAAHHAHGGMAHHMVKKHSMHSMKRSHHAKGGKVGHEEHGVAEWEHDATPEEVYAGAHSNVVKEASKKKRGGKEWEKVKGPIKWVGEEGFNRCVAHLSKKKGITDAKALCGALKREARKRGQLSPEHMGRKEKKAKAKKQ